MFDTEMLPHCVFAHGSESAPWSTKIQRLAKVAERYDFEVASPDQQHLTDATGRVEDFKQRAPNGSPLILIGSSMGGYVTAMACDTLQPDALFLMAPAFYLEGFPGDPTGCPKHTVVIHGWLDEVVPVDSSIDFARRHKAQLHVVADDHRLSASLEFLAQEFEALVQSCLE